MTTEKLLNILRSNGKSINFSHLKYSNYEMFNTIKKAKKKGLVKTRKISPYLLEVYLVEERK